MQANRINKPLPTAAWQHIAAGNAVHLLVLAFVFAALIWHWFGPVSGAYRFDRAVAIFLDEMALPGAWSMVGACTGFVLIILPASRDRLRASLMPGRPYARLAFVIVAVLLLATFRGPGTLVDMTAIALLGTAAVAVLSPRELLSRALAAVAGYLLVGYAFTLLKAGVFWQRATWDLQLMRVDRTLFSGLPHR